MNHEELAAEAHKLSRWERHRFMVLVGASIIIALILVTISMRLYTSSGAALLDLSRPGYVSVREQVSEVDRFEGFPSSGDIDQEALEKFRQLYKERAEQATSVDAFAGDVMSNEALSIDAPEDNPQE